MPLMKSGSKKAFQENVKTEMNAGKSQPQSLAISYSIQRKNKRKKMADGGEAQGASGGSGVPGGSGSPAIDPKKAKDMQDSSQKRGPTLAEGWENIKKGLAGYADGGTVKTQSRPMPRDVFHDDMDVMQNRRKKSLMGDDWTDDSWSDQASMSKSARPGTEEVSFDDESMINIDDEDHSIADAIMRRKRMAEGGMVDLDENATEEPNNEDQMSYEALKKENYSEEDGLDDLDQPEDSNEHGHSLEDEHDMIDSIRRKMKAKRGF